MAALLPPRFPLFEPGNLQAVRLAEFAAVTAAILMLEPHFLRLGSVLLGDLAALLDDYVAALPQAEGLLQQAKMIEFRSPRMVERLEPGGVHEIRHLNSVDQESVLLDRVAHFISVLGAVGRLRPQVRQRIYRPLEQLVA